MIFVDLDGVLADFDKKAMALFGKKPREIEDEIGSQKFWAEITNIHDFYLTLEKMHDADVLWEGIQKYDFSPTILTGVPMSMPWVPGHKREWCERYYPNAEVITCMSRDKATYCRPGDILIDDWPKYKPLWDSAGGIFIVHESAATTLIQLSLYFNDNKL